MQNTVHYQGARIELSQVGAAWQARVFLPGTISAHAFVPRATGPDGRAAVLERAKQLVNEVSRSDEVA